MEPAAHPRRSTLSFFGREHDNRIQPTHRFYNSTGTAMIKKILVIIMALALLLVCIVALRLRRDKPVGPGVLETSRLGEGPACVFQVDKPAFKACLAPLEISCVVLGFEHVPRRVQASP